MKSILDRILTPYLAYGLGFLILVGGISYGALSVLRTSTTKTKKSPRELPSQLLIRGAKLTGVQATDLEQALKLDPFDLESRTLLLGYYSGQGPFRGMPGSVKAAWRRHVLWLVSEQPDASVLADSTVAIYPERDIPGYLEGKALWLNHLQKEPMERKHVRHALAFLSHEDRELQLEILSRAQQEDPKNPEWYVLMAGVLIRGEGRTRSLKKERENVLEIYENIREGYALSPPAHASLLLRKVTDAAFLAGDLEAAADFALQLTETNSRSPLFRENWLIGHLFLGRIALVREDFDKAEEHLLASIDFPTGLSSDVPVPDLRLAKALLNQGRRAAVLAFLRDCPTRYELERQRFDDYVWSVENEIMPDFGLYLGSKIWN